LSRISDKLVAAGGTEVHKKDVHGIEYLRLIKVPQFFGKLQVEDQKELRGLTAGGNFAWSYEELRGLPEKFRSTMLVKGTLYKYFKFSQCMDTAIQKGYATSEDTTPGKHLSLISLDSLSQHEHNLDDRI
jgi:hypothetical protein